MTINGNMKGIITADVVGSTKIPQNQRGMLPDVLQQLVAQLQTICPMRLEIYRGDSFQIVVEQYEKSPLVAALLRVGMISKSIDKSSRLDARMSIGIGEVSYVGASVGQSDGEAFVLSGRTFESLGKQRLAITTADKGVNDELSVLAIILDDMLSHLTLAQSKAVFEFLFEPGITQKSIAEKLDMTPQMISKALRAANAAILALVLNRMEVVLTNNLSK